MNSKELVLQACAFQRPDRIPRFDSFWEFPESWRERLGDPSGLTDIEIWCPDETTFPSRARKISETDGWTIEIDGWGRKIRSKTGSYFSEILETPFSGDVAFDSVSFESPKLDTRYDIRGKNGNDAANATLRALDESKKKFCVFGKTGGPFLRTCFIRGEAQFLMDIAEDPPKARELAGKMADHLTAVGVEQIRRWNLADTGLWIYDDMAHNKGPMLSPKSFEKVFLPLYRSMIRAYKSAGAKYVFFHSDGNVNKMLDMLVDAGIDGLNPLERRAGMDIADIRRRYPKLILAGGMCNTVTLLRGTRKDIEAEAKEIIDMGRNGGVIIGTHSISPEIPLDNFIVYQEFCKRYGNYQNK